MSLICAVDPGKTACGFCLYELDANGKRRLIACNFLEAPDTDQLAKLVRDFLANLVVEPSVDVLITEFQQIYGGPRRNDPNDLLPLTYLVGAVHALVDAGKRVRPLPKEWKGTTPKAVYTNRIKKALTEEELAALDALKLPKDKIHNVIDAMGMVLWHLGVKV